MIRRTASILFLLLANLILLVHTVIPHHHHANLICFKHDLQLTDNHDDNHHDKDNDICSLQNIIVIVQNNQEIKSVSPQNYIDQFNNSQALLSNSNQYIPIQSKIIWLKHYHSPPYYSPLFENNKGLRGPPLV